MTVVEPPSEDHRMDIAAWLRGLGLEQYAPAFRDNAVDGEVLPELPQSASEPYPPPKPPGERSVVLSRKRRR